MAPQFDESRHVPCQNAGSVPRAAEGIEGREQIPNGGMQPQTTFHLAAGGAGLTDGGAAGGEGKNSPSPWLPVKRLLPDGAARRRGQLTVLLGSCTPLSLRAQ
jgi:hypothetical protein